MSVRRGTALILALVLLGAAWTQPVRGKSEQNVFDMVMLIQVNPDGSAHFDISARLTNPAYRELVKNETDFTKLVEELVYRNLVEDLHERYGNFTVYLPSSGPVEVTANWSARVNFYIVPFLTKGKRGLECPYSGPLDFVSGGKVYSFEFRRIILVLPRNWTVLYTFPSPADRAKNVLIWENADYLPMIGVSTGSPGEGTSKHLSCKPLRIELHYSPEEGKVFFNATYICEAGLPALPGARNVTYIKRCNVTEVRGYFVPRLEYDEGLFRREWRAEIELPEEFPQVVGGSRGKNGSIVITVKRSSAGIQTAVPVIFIAVIIALWRWKR